MIRTKNYFYNKFIIDDIRFKVVKVDTVHYCSDGPLCQLENKFNFTNLLFYKHDNHTLADWNFFATSHGKRENA